MKSRNQADLEANVAIGRTIRTRRAKLGLRQTECARFAGISDASLCNLEKGSAQVSARHLIRLAPILKISPAALLDEALIPVVGPRGLKRDG